MPDLNATEVYCSKTISNMKIGPHLESGLLKFFRLSHGQCFTRD